MAAGGLNYKPGRVTVRHMLDVIVDDIGETAVRDKVVRPLTGLRLAPYYGCQVVRPIADDDSTEYPMKMDHLLGWLGAEVVPYPAKAHCCGGHMTQISEPQAFELIRRLLQNAADNNAEMIVCMCPMCQLNLDGYQGRVNGYFGTEFRLPIMYFTQMLGIAFGTGAKQARLRQGACRRDAGIEGKARRTTGRSIENISFPRSAWNTRFGRSASLSATEQVSHFCLRPASTQSVGTKTFSRRAWERENRSRFRTENQELIAHNGDVIMAEKIGIYVCHCGSNIAGTIDVEEVARWAGKNVKNVVVSKDYKFMCSSLGQQMIEDDIKEQGLTGVVVGACSPHLHEKTFRNTCKRAGLNPFLCQMTNLREHVSWVNADKAAGTIKAKSLISAAAERVKHQQPLEPMRVKVNPATLVVGGGIAGLQATLELADAGYHVYLVEREPSIGGHMAQFDKTFPTLDCSACILTPKMSEVGNHPNVTLLSY